MLLCCGPECSCFGNMVMTGCALMLAFIAILVSTWKGRDR